MLSTSMSSSSSSSASLSSASASKIAAANMKSSQKMTGRRGFAGIALAHFLLFGFLLLSMASSACSSRDLLATTEAAEQQQQPADIVLLGGNAGDLEANKVGEVGEHEQQEQQQAEAGQASGNGEEGGESCDIHHNEPLHALMDRICELCHDMYSHQRPNMRADCRSDCFRSSNFKRCLRLFRPIASSAGTGRSRGMRHMAEAMDALMLF